MSQNCVAEAGGDFWGHLVSPLLHGATQSSWPCSLSTSPRYAHHLSACLWVPLVEPCPLCPSSQVYVDTDRAQSCPTEECCPAVPGAVQAWWQSAPGVS